MNDEGQETMANGHMAYYFRMASGGKERGQASLSGLWASFVP